MVIRSRQSKMTVNAIIKLNNDLQNTTHTLKIKQQEPGKIGVKFMWPGWVSSCLFHVNVHGVVTKQ